jgi:substrate import-associated zinc metallohydrolase lipoprotein
MKKFLIYAMALTVSLVYLSSCNNDEISSRSIYDTGGEEEPLNKVGQWILDSFVKPYNIEVMYRWSDYETDMTKDLTPPTEDTVVPFLKVVKKVWMDVYEELASVPAEGISGGDVMKPVFPKQLLLIGSEAFNDDGSAVMGAAEGGRKITLTALDLFNPKFMTSLSGGKTQNDYGRALNEDNYIHTLHHEFCHILNQKKDFPITFQEITSSSYTAQWTSETRAGARTLGFVSPYAMAAPGEDFAETLSMYIINTPERWNAQFNVANNAGVPLIAQKLGLVRTYMLENWGIDLDVLRELTLKAIDDVENGNY